ncbi:DUF6030 family protein [Rhizobiaceae bacterium BDR2-2]|uniref:DUF6030 family protein n=1 Tax=Ectorhizobium quercum TaxID=2965071 RepID=A0AAE3N568_9HYPH|nr:DUF6030 family protein [Ectorhizobium quercum]MCX8996214.1 DUF6030 family protein [Ectorhizobium quercum]MCX8998747.1 DUF6030 family protein [Ectorhizobium quercum]
MPVRKNRGFFLGMTMAIVLAIAATVLFANDRRHLNALLIHYGMMEPPQPPEAASQKHARATPQAVPPPNAVALFSGSGTTPFARMIHFPAPEMCRLFNDRGFVGEGWHTSPMAGEAQAECTAEKMIGTETEAGAPASLFAVVRGTQHDDIKSLRVKMIAPQTAEGNAARKEMDEILADLIEATGWSDLTPLRERIARLEDNIDMTDSSLSVTFRQEYTNTDAYNLIIRPASTNPDVRQLQKPARPGAFNR